MIRNRSSITNSESAGKLQIKCTYIPSPIERVQYDLVQRLCIFSLNSKSDRIALLYLNNRLVLSPFERVQWDIAILVTLKLVLGKLWGPLVSEEDPNHYPFLRDNQLPSVGWFPTSSSICIYRIEVAECPVCKQGGEYDVWTWGIKEFPYEKSRINTRENLLYSTLQGNLILE